MRPAERLYMHVILKRNVDSVYWEWQNQTILFTSDDDTVDVGGGEADASPSRSAAAEGFAINCSRNAATFPAKPAVSRSYNSHKGSSTIVQLFDVFEFFVLTKEAT